MASRRARTGSSGALTDTGKIAIIEEAARLKGWDPDEFYDDDVLDVWARFVDDRKTPKPIRDYVRFFYSPLRGTGIFATFEHWEGVLSNTPQRESA